MLVIKFLKQNPPTKFCLFSWVLLRLNINKYIKNINSSTEKENGEKNIELVVKYTQTKVALQRVTRVRESVPGTKQ